jgi:tungstate transport system substrate-binding protein
MRPGAPRASPAGSLRDAALCDGVHIANAACTTKNERPAAVGRYVMHPTPRRSAIAAVLCSALLFAGGARAQDARSIVVASTTSTEQSGLFSHLLPAFKRDSGIDARVVAVGTGQALDMGRRGDADVVFVHDPGAEDKFVAEGFGVKRFPVMVNDFVLIGPKSDPARVKGQDIQGALARLGASTHPFVSRGDKSGTHAAELRYWKAANVDMARAKPAGYKECGCGMGPALNLAAQSNAYVLADRGTWLAFKNRADLAIVVEGDRRLFNQYGVMLVNPARHPHVKKDLGQAFIDWIVSPKGQQTIAAYRIDGEQLFFPNATAPK